jgi:hypothetical protein
MSYGPAEMGKANQWITRFGLVQHSNSEIPKDGVHEQVHEIQATCALRDDSIPAE